MINPYATLMVECFNGAGPIYMLLYMQLLKLNNNTINRLERLDKSLRRLIAHQTDKEMIKAEEIEH